MEFCRKLPNSPYLWCSTNNKTGGYNGPSGSVNNKIYFCDAKPRNLGEDWLTSYVYDVEMVKTSFKRYAYVECDYVR